MNGHTSSPGGFFVLHAGATNSWETNLDRQQAIQNVLSDVASTARASLRAGALALDVVQAAVVALEDCPFFNAGKGSALTEDGSHELEAAIVDGNSGRYGAVAGVTKVKNPIQCARAVLNSGRHPFIFGTAADEFAESAKLALVDNSHFTTSYRKSHWESRMAKVPAARAALMELGTVGAVALDVHGKLAAAGSTGGMTCKTPGRLGDTAVMGAGILANGNTAIVCSGSGDDILRQMVASKISSLQKTKPLKDAVAEILEEFSRETGQTCAVVALDSTGQSVVHSNARLFWTASSSSSSPALVTPVENTVPFFPQHAFYERDGVSAGLSRFPVAPGQAVIVCPRGAPLVSLQKSEFQAFMKTVRNIAVAVRDAVSAKHCGLVTADASSVSLIPFPGLKETGVPIHSDELEYYPVYPGYLSSKNGPQMDRSLLDSLHKKIKEVTRLNEPLDYTFYGDADDKSLFGRLIRGELPQWRIWESDTHIALLTPTGKTPGYTVVMPRRPIGPDILLLDDSDYEGLLAATHSVMQALKTALGLHWCGMFFEGFEGTHAHVMLIPIHEPSPEQRRDIPIQGPASFSENYRGFLTTRYGSLSANLDELAGLAAKTRRLINQTRRISIPYSWKAPSKHALKALQSPWYTIMFRMQSTMYHDAVELFQRVLGYEYLVVPITTASISSPMGLGSDSEPVPIQLWGQDDYLADSQQFALEWGLRLQDGLRGVYYCGTSCRGEDPDSAHLNQFCHFECELPGGLDDGITVAERYIVHTTKSLLRKFRDEIVTIAGTTKHIDDVLQLWTSRGGNFPRVTLDEALSLPGVTPDMWCYVVPDRPELGKSLTRKGELMLMERCGGAVWLTEMHHQSVPFYQAYLDGDPTKASCADFLVGLGEIMGCGARHETADQVLDSLSRHEVDACKYSWYVDMRRLKPMKTVGWGMGIERYLCWIMQHMDVRDIQLMLRLKGSVFSP